jgi:hypothetical protein
MLTYFDLVESLIVSSYGGPQDAEQRDIRTAVHRAYDELTTIRDWSYYQTHGRIFLQAPFNTGTVSVTGLGVTLTGGTFPTWAALGGYLKIGEEIVRVAARPTGTNLTLDPVLRLKANVTNRPYTLYRTVYPLPANFRNLDEPTDEYNWWSGLYITPDQAMKLERVSNSSGEPYHWTVIKDPATNGWAIKIIGYPTKVETLDFTYRRSARPIRWSGHEPSARAGTVTCLLDGFVTGSGSNFFPSMLGSALRVGDTATSPGPIESLAPYTAETLINSVADSGIMIVSPALNEPAGTKYLITDPIDVAPHMEQAMDSACDYWLARIRGTKPDEAFAMYQRDLRLAMERDQLAPLSGRSRNVWHDGGWRSPLRPDQGA